MARARRKINVPAGVVWGCLERDSAAGNGRYKTARQLGIVPLPQTEWVSWSLLDFAGKSTAQGSTGTCVGHGTAKGIETTYRSTGVPDVKQGNGFALYAQTKWDLGNRRVSWGSGLNLEDCLNTAAKKGCPEVTPDWPAEATTSGWPKDYEARFARRKVLEWGDLEGDPSNILALIWTIGQTLSRCSVIGTDVFGGGHCVPVHWGRVERGTFYFGGLNSWGTKRTNTDVVGGWEFDYNDMLHGGLDKRGCWFPRLITDASGAAA